MLLSLFFSDKTKRFPFHRNAATSNAEAIKVPSPEDVLQKAFILALKASGYGRISGDRSAVEMLPCPVGTFSNSSSQGNEGCIPCPPGILCVGSYSDKVGT